MAFLVFSSLGYLIFSEVPYQKFLRLKNKKFIETNITHKGKAGFMISPEKALEDL
jgi:hypothetical protein